MPNTRLPLDYGVEIELHDLLTDHYNAAPSVVAATVAYAEEYGFTVTESRGRVYLRHHDVDLAQEFVLEHGYELDDVAPACDLGHRVHRPTCPACN